MKSLSLRLFLAFILAFILSILPMPAFLSWFRPPWLLLLLLYIEYFLPRYFTLTLVLLTGLVLDVLTATVLGAHPFALLLSTWMASSKSRRFKYFSISQQMGLLGFFSLFYMMLLSITEAFLGLPYNLFLPIIAAVITVFLWPLLRVIAEDLLFDSY